VASMLLFQKSAEQEWNPQPHERESFTWSLDHGVLPLY
jgi:hypothetical protein